jgi:hypothetical protein
VEILGSAAAAAAAIYPAARSAKGSALSFPLQAASGRVKARVEAKRIEDNEKCDVYME